MAWHLLLRVLFEKVSNIMVCYALLWQPLQICLCLWSVWLAPSIQHRCSLINEHSAISIQPRCSMSIQHRCSISIQPRCSCRERQTKPYMYVSKIALTNFKPVSLLLIKESHLIKHSRPTNKGMKETVIHILKIAPIILFPIDFHHMLF